MPTAPTDLGVDAPLPTAARHGARLRVPALPVCSVLSGGDRGPRTLTVLSVDSIAAFDLITTAANPLLLFVRLFYGRCTASTKLKAANKATP